VTSAGSFERALVEAKILSRGHFRYESGHHGDVWLDLDALFVDARAAREHAAALARLAQSTMPQVVCGPLTGGAFAAQLVAAELGAEFIYAERRAADGAVVRYRLPDALRGSARGKRVLVVDDAINAGSAVLATAADLRECGAEIAGFASLIALGNTAAEIARRESVPLLALATVGRELWRAEDCPLCRAGRPLARNP
jgi:orotate phosphoribosyltransferase